MVWARLVHVWRFGAQLAECPTWIAASGQLAWIDGIGRRYHRLDPNNGVTQSFETPTRIGSAAPLPSGGALLGLADGLGRIDGDGRIVRLPSPVTDGVSFNDGKCDSAGRWWVGSRTVDEADGALFRVVTEVGTQRMLEGFQVCNGMGWSPDATSFYLIDTVPRIVHRYAFDPALGAVGKGGVLHRFDGRTGKPDGMAVDAAGRLWCAMWDGGGIAILSAEGAPLGWLDVPARRPTSCAFGGPDLRTLFVTTASVGTDLDDPVRGEAGAILQYDVEVPGTPVNLFDDQALLS